MPKFAEINYLRVAGPKSAEHALNKPFADDCCGRYLMDLGQVMTLLPPAPARILDLGVGSGWTTVFLARRGYDVVGQDISPDMIALAERNRERYAAETASFMVSDYESMSFEDRFDAALFHDALHHAEDERAALSAVYRALAPRGICITVEPGEGHAAASQDTVAAFGVTEQDMPPHRIIEAGRAVGFRRFRIYARMSEPRLLAETGAIGALLPEMPSRWRAALGFARKAVRALIRGPRTTDGDFLDSPFPPLALRQGNLVWMQK